MLVGPEGQSQEKSPNEHSNEDSMARIRNLLGTDDVSRWLEERDAHHVEVITGERADSEKAEAEGDDLGLVDELN